MQETADVLTKLFLCKFQTTTNWIGLNLKYFSDGLIQDRGWFDVRIDFDDHINGEVRITQKDPVGYSLLIQMQKSTTQELGKKFLKPSG